MKSSYPLGSCQNLGFKINIRHYELGVKWDVYLVPFSCHILVFLYFVLVHVF